VANSKAGFNGRRSHRKRGQSLVEFALVFPIFMMVLSGIMDFGFMLYSRMSVINASREAAHAAILATDYGIIPTIASGTAVSVASQGGVGISSGSVSTTCLATSTGSNTPLGSCGAAQPGDSVVVTVSYTYHSFFPLFFGATFNLSSTTQMVIE